MRTYNVLLAFERSQKANREKTAGIIAYAGARPDWVLHFIPPNLSPRETERTNARLKPDGAIITTTVRGTSFPCPVIGLDGMSHAPSTCADISCDDRAVGRIAAETLLQHGFRHFAYLGVNDKPEIPHSELRRTAFADAVRLGGGSSEVPAFAYDYFASRNLESADLLAEWLKRLPKPCGLFAYNDFLCQSLLPICNHIGVKVPEQLGVIGVDNELDICENSNPTLSSIEPDFFGAGYRAAELLDRFIRKGQPKRLRSFRYGIKTVCRRMSTAGVAGPMLFAARVAERIRTSEGKDITVRSLAEEFGLSERTLENRFKSRLGKGLKDEIIRARLESVTRLLSSGSVPIGSIAAMTGFGSSENLRTAFRKRYHMTLGEYRRTSRSPAKG